MSVPMHLATSVYLLNTKPIGYARTAVEQRKLYYQFIGKHYTECLEIPEI